MTFVFKSKKYPMFAEWKVPKSTGMTGIQISTQFWLCFQKLSRIKQRIGITKPDEMVLYHPVFLFADIGIILLIRYLPNKCFIQNFGGKPPPFLKLGNRHFLFHITSIMRLISPIISLPHRIIFAFLIVTPL